MPAHLNDPYEKAARNRYRTTSQNMPNRLKPINSSVPIRNNFIITPRYFVNTGREDSRNYSL